MLCPECLKKGEETKLKCVDSRPMGPFKQSRRYECPACKFDIINIEQLEIPENTPKNLI